MAKKKKHWSAIFRFLGYCDEAVRRTEEYPTLAAAWRVWNDGFQMEDFCDRLVRMGGARSCHMWRGGKKDESTVTARTPSAKRYWRKFPLKYPAPSADDVRKYFPRPPCIPPKLLKEAGLL